MQSPLIDWIVRKLKEPSSYIGFFALLDSALPNMHFSQALQASITQTGIGIAGLLFILLNESHPAPPNTKG